jgi:hypothetical protein
MVARIRFFFWIAFIASFGFAQTQAPSPASLVGTDRGLYGLAADGTVTPLWTGGAIKKLLPREGLSPSAQYTILSDRGIYYSADLQTWESANQDLPSKVIKNYENGKKSFVKVTQDLKDLSGDPQNPTTLVTATKDAVFLSRDRGKTWKSLGFPPAKTNGIRAVAVAELPSLTVFVSHSIYGVYYLEADTPGATWTSLNRGLENLETTENPDEVSCFAVQPPEPHAPEGQGTQVFAGQSFRGRIYRLDWKSKTFIPLWSDGGNFGTVESLRAQGQTLQFVQENRVFQLALPEVSNSPKMGGENPDASQERTDITDQIRALSAKLGQEVAYYQSNSTNPSGLSELWQINQSSSFQSPYRSMVEGKRGLYLPVNHTLTPKLLAPYLSLIDEKKLNMAVIDMKDDYGRLRFTPKNPAIAAKGRVFNPVDVESLVSTLKAHGVYLVARIVVFKDSELAKKDGGKYAIWDGAKNIPWVGYYETKKKVETPPSLPSSAPNGNPGASSVGPQTDDPVAYGTSNNTSAGTSNGVSNNGTTGTANGASAGVPTVKIQRNYYDERWVDPYSEEVWDYITSIAQELRERGFDEIQFDYIRFPTDGINLSDARYRWRDPGMDMESAIISFMNHVRSHVSAPISIDIYGANGWYRTGARTGQEVEILSHYVDVICPMYYPSHFEQTFLANPPEDQRPYRIYYQGIRRTNRIARGKIVVRPYVQSFYMNVAYDRRYYNADYVQKEVDGVRDAGNGGLTFWNNGGRYDEIPNPEPIKAAQGPLRLKNLD